MEYHNGSASIGGKWSRSKTDYISLDVDWHRHAYYYYYTATTLVEDYEKSAGTPYYPYFPYLPDQKELQSDQQRTMAALKGVFTLPLENIHSAMTGSMLPRVSRVAKPATGRRPYMCKTSSTSSIT